MQPEAGCRGFVRYPLGFDARHPGSRSTRLHIRERFVPPCAIWCSLQKAIKD